MITPKINNSGLHRVRWLNPVENMNIIGKWLDYSKAVDYMIEHREDRIQMEVEVVDGTKMFVLYTEGK